MILRTEDNTYFNLSHFSSFGIEVSKGGTFIVSASYPASEVSESLFQSTDEKLAQSVLAEIMRRLAMGEDCYSIHKILDQLNKPYEEQDF